MPENDGLALHSTVWFLAAIVKAIFVLLLLQSHSCNHKIDLENQYFTSFVYK